MGVFRSILGFLGVSTVTKASPVPISRLKEKFFKPSESAAFDDLLNTAISLGVTVSVDPETLDREGNDGKYDPISNNIVMPAIPDRGKPEFYELMEILSHELYHASKYKAVLNQAKTEQERRQSLKLGAAKQQLQQFVKDNVAREWAAQDNALAIVFEVAQKDPKAPNPFKKLNVPAGLNGYKSKNERHYKDWFLALYLSWTHPEGTKAPGETVPEIQITPPKPKQNSNPFVPKKSPSPPPLEKKRQRPGGYNFYDPARKYRLQTAVNQAWQQTAALRRQNEAIAETNRRIRAANQSYYDAQRRIAGAYQPGKSFFPGTAAASYPNASISRGAPGRYSSSSTSSDWWRRQRPGANPQTTPPLPSQSTTFQRRPGYGGGMFDNLFRRGSPVPAGLRYPWDSPGWRSYKEPRNRTYDR